jgi:hypothetical protein
LEKSIPGWRDEVEPYKKDAVFWHAIWESAGRPNRGGMKDFIAKTRNQYHYSIRRVKKMSDSTVQDNYLK